MITVAIPLSQAVEVCIQHGLRVDAPNYGTVETPSEFCARVNINIKSLHRTLNHIPADVPMKIERSAGGRILWVRATAEAEKWIEKRKRRAGL